MLRFHLRDLRVDAFFLPIRTAIKMDLRTVHLSGCARSMHPGVGATPTAWDGFTPAGGGGEAILRLVKWLEETFYKVINIDQES